MATATSTTQINPSISSLQAPVFVITESGLRQHRASESVSLPSSRLALTTANNDNVRSRWPVRIMIAALGIFACVVMSSVRYNLSVAIVAMVEDSCTPQKSVCGEMQRSIFELSATEHKVNAAATTTTTMATARKSNDYNNITFLELTEALLGGFDNELGGEGKQNEIRSHALRAVPPETKKCTKEVVHHGSRLNWTDAEQGVALGSYYYGFAPMHILGGRLAERFGAKWITFIGLVGAAIANAFLPLIAMHSFVGFVIVRAITGFFHSVVQPALYSLFLNWFPQHEQTQALASLAFGSAVGLIINLAMVNVIHDLGAFNDWPYLFYGGTALHLVWAVFWVWLVTDKPEVHRLIEHREVTLIRANSHNILEENLSIPWLSIAKSKVVYAIIVAKFAFGFNHAVVIDNGPSYLNNVAGFGMERTSVHIAIVYTITALTVLFLGHLYPRIKKYFPLRQLHLRKIFQAIVFLGSAITMFILPSVGCNEAAILALIMVNMFTQGFFVAGEYPLVNETAGNYSGTISGLALTFDSIARLLAPLIRGELVKRENSLVNWNVIFYITGVVNIVGFLVFTSLASTSLQWWAMRKDDGAQHEKEIPKTEKQAMKRAMENQNFRLPINTNDQDWLDFKNSVQVP